ncbi:MAG: hypothetical protein ABSC92_01885 [Rhizomicrobium sp.]|jgi:hypothetical protein
MTTMRDSMPVALVIFRLIYVAFIVTASVTTLLSEKAPGLPAFAGIPTLTILASAEILAAILFLFRWSEVWACAALLVVYAIATAISVIAGDWTLRFLYYGATAVFIALAARARRHDVGYTQPQA